MKAEHDRWFVETILSSIADGVFTVDHHWRITSFNRAAERITGVPAQQAMGQRCADVFHASICQRGCAMAQTMATGQELIDVPARIRNSAGEQIPISISTAVLRGNDGAMLGAVETFRDLSALEQLRREIEHRYTFADIVGKSPAMQKIFTLLPDVAQSDATTLIEGPSGSGKELMARALHNLSHRAHKPLVVVNCGALPESLFESELFGYQKGAFTDARQDKPGRLQLAQGGTLFLDEVAELPPATQVKLLRVLQEREYEPLGAVQTRPADVRVVAATNKKLLERVSQGKFRDDLYFRLAVVRLDIPPLARRRADIPLLVQHFVRRFNTKRGKQITGVSPAVLELLMRHRFPGNVRELENIIEHGFVLCHDGVIDLRHLPEELQRGDAGEPPSAAPAAGLMQGEADTIRAALAQADGHLGQTAAALGISRTTLWRKMKRHGVKAG